MLLQVIELKTQFDQGVAENKVIERMQCVRKQHTLTCSECTLAATSGPVGKLSQVEAKIRNKVVRICTGQHNISALVHKLMRTQDRWTAMLLTGTVQ